MDASPYVIGALDDGLRVLMLFIKRESVTVSQAAAIGLTRSKAHRILSTLQARGLVELAPNRRGYVPGPGLMQMAMPLGMDLDSRLLARSVLEDVRARSGETVHAGIQVGSQVLIFDSLETTLPDEKKPVGPRTGQLRPAYCTSAGKLLLSRLSQTQLGVLFPEEELPQLTRWTHATRTALLEDLAKIATQDYAINQQESEYGICGVAVLLKGRTWRDRVSIHASVPSARGSREQLEALAAHMREAVASRRV